MVFESHADTCIVNTPHVSLPILLDRRVASYDRVVALVTQLTKYEII